MIALDRALGPSGRRPIESRERSPRSRKLHNGECPWHRDSRSQAGTTLSHRCVGRLHAHIARVSSVALTTPHSQSYRWRLFLPLTALRSGLTFRLISMPCRRFRPQFSWSSSRSDRLGSSLSLVGTFLRLATLPETSIGATSPEVYSALLRGYFAPSRSGESGASQETTNKR